jgi:3-deoxy-7-phosphoheptulonate synthase
MAVAAVAAGADGVMVEIHAEPERALSDGYQSLTPASYEHMMTQCRLVAQVLGRTIG